jgi:hypothetical protein
VLEKYMAMKISVRLLLVTLVLYVLPARGQHPVVIIELFTSEGCSSCPPADALFTELNRRHLAGGAELILLGEHVEYWNSLGWTDRFSAPVFTQRQRDYVRQLRLATAYTPQIVIDGHFQTVGSDTATVQRLIEQAATLPKPAQVSLRFDESGRLQVSVEDSSQGNRRVLLAITENDLTSAVKSGENGGRVLRHSAVVRQLEPLGTVQGGRFETALQLPTRNDWKRPDLRVAVLVQDAKSGQILGGASIPYLQQRAPAIGR